MVSISNMQELELTVICNKSNVKDKKVSKTLRHLNFKFKPPSVNDRYRIHVTGQLCR
jgi:hypothetical protein